MIGIVLLCLILAATVIGGLVGALKGFIKVKSWGVEFLLVALIGVPVCGLITSKTGASLVGGFISIGITVLLLVLLMIGFTASRKGLSKRVEKYLQFNYYSKYIENEQTTAQILGAISVEDKKEYKKLIKQKNKKKRGVWGVLDRVFGGITLAVKGMVITGLIAIVILVILDFTRLAQDGGALYGMFGKIYGSGMWKFFKNSLLDYIVVFIMMLCIRSGFANGIFSSLWTFVVLLMVVGVALLAYRFAFKVDDFIAAAEKLSMHIADKLSKAESLLSKIKLTPMKISQLIIAAGMFLLMLVGVILFAVFVPRLIDVAREGKAFRIIDGVLGGIVLTAIIVGLLLLVGAIANSMYEVQFMSVFNAYFEKGKLATYFYDNNLLNSMGILNNLPFGKWLGAE